MNASVPARLSLTASISAMWQAMIVVPAVFVAHHVLTGTPWDPAWVWALAGAPVAGAEAWLAYRQPSRPMVWRRRVLAAMALGVSLLIVASAELAMRFAV